MKDIREYICEGLFNPETIKSDPINIHPKNTAQLQRVIITYSGNCTDDIIDLNWIDTSKIKSMKSLFHHKQIIDKNFDISKWDVSNVKDMSIMFWGCKNFNCDISGWDVSNVESMNCMFHGCSSFNQDLNKWDVSNVKDIHSMFYGCSLFDPAKQIKDWKPTNLRRSNYYQYPEDMRKIFAKTKGDDYPKWFVNFYNTVIKMNDSKYDDDSIVKFKC